MSIHYSVSTLNQQTPPPTNYPHHFPASLPLMIPGKARGKFNSRTFIWGASCPSITVRWQTVRWLCGTLCRIHLTLHDGGVIIEDCTYIRTGDTVFFTSICANLPNRMVKLQNGAVQTGLAYVGMQVTREAGGGRNQVLV